MVSVLVVAGSDSGGGAGIQADLKALAALGVHACTALTCVTAQNTQGVDATYPLPLEAIRQQVETVLEDISIRAVKTGMLYSEDVAAEVAALLRDVAVPIVVDPVMVATVGASLHTSGLLEGLRAHLLPRATLLTPNLDEAEALTGKAIRDVKGMEAAARAIQKLGPESVLVKGGHLAEDLVDVLYDGEAYHRFPGYRYPRPLHGSGCAYASTIAGYLAQGVDLVTSVSRSRRRIAAGFETAYAVGQGVGLVNAGYMENRYAVWEAVQDAVDELVTFLPPDLVPEVGVNLGYALPAAEDPHDVCAVEGRIVRRSGRAVAVGPARFGASTHVARIILTAMRFNPANRSAMNVRYSEDLVARGTKRDLSVGTFDRTEEPEDVSTMEWGTAAAIRELERVPDLIYDQGGPGKVPMMRILGKTPPDVLRKLRSLVGE